MSTALKYKFKYEHFMLEKKEIRGDNSEVTNFHGEANLIPISS